MAERVLEVSDLTKSFGAVRAADSVTFDLRSGEIHALIGPNGAGKTTLLHLVSGGIEPDAGTVRFLGNDVGQLDLAGRARLGMGRTFQVSSLIPEYSALRNVMLAVQARQGSAFRFCASAANDSTLVRPALEALSRVGLEHRASVPAEELSHGERRKLEISIVLALGAKAFLLDEPMAGLGPEGSRELTGLLRTLRQEAPILLVEHDMDAVFALADRISVLVYGRIIATGTVEEIRKDRGVREAYLGDAH